MPVGLGAGFVLTNENDISWQVLAEYKIQDWSAYETSFSSVEENNMFRDSKEFAVALIYQPIKNTSRTDLLENIGATLGYRTKETYLMVGENGLEENAFSVGVSIPLLGSKTWSKINLGTEFGNRSIDGSTFVDESYTNFSLGISFSPHLRYRWFERKKYN